MVLACSWETGRGPIADGLARHRPGTRVSSGSTNKGRVMSRMWMLVLAVSVLPWAGWAQEDEESNPTRKRGQMTEEQKAVREEMLKKYDVNKNGKIDAEERKLITPADKEKLARVGLGPVTPRRRPPLPQAPQAPPAPK